MPIKKSELYSSLWRSCDELRGGMDASQYKDYILILLFVKYVSDKFVVDPDSLIQVPEGGSFKDMVALKGRIDIGDKMNVIISKLAEVNELKGVIDVADFNNEDKLGKGKEMQDRLSKLVAIFDSSFDFSRNRAEGDDILGDAYEYLMRHFATESGKSKGQFYTPAEVSRVIAKVIGISKAIQTQTIYDPTCGSGSLLIKAADETQRGISIYGQEMDNATKALAKMNMILHNNATAEIQQGNTLSSPAFIVDGNLKTFDFAVANPPFSSKAWSNGFSPKEDIHKRFEDGVPPDKNGDYAFLLHMIRSLKSKGKGAIILPHGVLFRGNAEAEIRKNIIRKGYIKGIIGLPANLFYGTGIPACIIVIDKENADSRRGIFMIDASKGYVKDGNKNRLRHQDIHKIVDVFNNQIPIEKYSRMVSTAEIEANDFNLNIPRYIDSQEPEDIQDIEAHLLGGIPNRDIEDLENYWQAYPSLKSELFTPTRANYRELKTEPSNIKNVIYNHPEFKAFINQTTIVFNSWSEKHTPNLKNIKVGAKPKALIQELSEDVLQSFSKVKLIDKYDIYQGLMAYWTDSMQDDVYMIADDGWEVGKKLRLILDDKKNKEKPDLEIDKQKYKADLIPPTLIINRYFLAEQEDIQKLEIDCEAISRQIEELEEEHSGEEGILEELKNDSGKVNKAEVQKRVKELKGLFAKKDTNEVAELKVLEEYLSFTEKEALANKRVKDAKAALDKKVKAKYQSLSIEEVKTLVVDDKWMTMLNSCMQSELERISQNLTQRIKQLAERYNKPLPAIAKEVDELTARVNAHLEKMGFVWK